MTAGIFAAHGVWTGTCRQADKSNRKGYFENASIRDIVMQWHKAIVHDGRLATKRPGFREAIEQAIKADGWGGGPWLWKGSALYWPAFFEFTPKWIVCIRSPQQIFASCRRSGIFGAGLDDEALRQNIALHQGEMNYLVKARQAVRVYTADVAHGDYSSIERALEYCGIKPDRKAIDQFVDRSLWNA